MKRKICALGLTAALSISLLTTTAFAAETSFQDVSGHWAAEAISAVVEKKLFNGTSEDTFSPDASMNRGMFVTVLGRFAENMGYEVSGSSTFSDVAADAYYARYVAWGAANSIVKGVSETEFSPNADVTREANKHSNDSAKKYQKLARIVGLPSATPKVGVANLIAEINRLLKYMDRPTCITECGISLEEFEKHREEIVKRALADACTVANPRKVEAKDINRILDKIAK